MTQEADLKRNGHRGQEIKRGRKGASGGGRRGEGGERDMSFSHPQQGRVDFNTVNPSLSTGMDILIHPCRWIDYEENVRTPPKLEIYLDP